ncbi:hypothetical protein EDB82DRAFT_576223 [Fusarium venenatum]|uniref:uncharacterized protein n=1 Tax=Fusarium venenatum TaxID=56646 RepID=UPI001DA6DE4B|nr:hypothetical protein EDB82DRAFT_576223 [Fusarium venenatum]
MLRSFENFRSLPLELQDEMWSSGIRPAKPGIHIFRLTSDYKSKLLMERHLEAPWAVKYRLSTPSEGPHPFRGGTVSFAEVDPPTYLVDASIWNTCRQSRHVMKRKLAPIKRITIWSTTDRGNLRFKTNALESKALEDIAHKQCTIVVCPGRDLFILQLDDPSMFSWSQSADTIPDDLIPALMPMQDVGWRYRSVWASSLYILPRTQSLDSLCSFIVCASRFGELKTLWLIIDRIKRKNWVPSRRELDKPEPKGFETDNFQLTEVIIDDASDWDGSTEQLPWGEFEDESHYLADLLAFVHHLRLFVANASYDSPNIDFSV